MLLISDSHNVYYNLALEEYLLETWRSQEELVLLYRNSPAVVVGAHQNTHWEANSLEMQRRGIRLARRISGGGTVYHDMGNVCFSFVVPGQNTSRLDLPLYLKPVEQALHTLGIPAVASARNDMMLGDRKITGTAARMKSDCLLFHGTLLYDADLDNLRGVLHPEPGLLQSRGSASVKSPVVNIRTQYDWGDTGVFMQQLADALCPGASMLKLTAAEQELVDALAVEKYTSRQWIFGRNPACTFAVLVGERGGALRSAMLSLKGDRVCSASDAALEHLLEEEFVPEVLTRRMATLGMVLKIDQSAAFCEG